MFNYSTFIPLKLIVVDIFCLINQMVANLLPNNHL